MVYKRSSLRYAHTTGHTSLAYTDNGEFIITCGSDGDIRKWRGIDDDDPSSHCLGEFVICIAHTGEKLLASTDRNTVQAYTFPDMDNDGTLLRFTAPVTCMRAHESLLVAGSEDTIIKVLHTNTGDEARQALQLEGHTGPVLGLDVAPTKGFLASIAGDGHLKIWQLDTGAELKSITGLKRTNSFEGATCYGTPSFEPHQQHLLAYVNGKEVHVLSTDNWEPLYTLSDERCQGDYTCCQFCTDGRFLAAGTDKGEISVFDVTSKRALKCEAPASDCQAITCLTWQRDSNSELAYCDANGQLGTLFSDANENGATLLDNAAEEVDYGDIEFGGAAEGDDFENGDDDDDDGVSIERLKSKVMQAYNTKGGDDDENTRDTVTSEAATAGVLGTDVPKAFKMQSAFQPGATPDHLEHRYLVWNDVGIVCAHSDSADGAIDVEFHDASVHHALHIANYNNHNMASLSTGVLALSASGAGKLVCIALAASGNKEWSVQMPDCETVDALAATSTLVGVVTSMHFLRLYSVLGTQREVLSLPGPVVAMAGHAQDLLICYHSAPSSGEQQHLAAMLVQTRGLQLRVQQLPLALPPGRQLSWLGFSDAGSPLAYDSMGLLQLYSARNGCWHPICDTLKHSQSVSNNFYIVAASERSQIVQAVLCRGSSYPMTNPRPMLQELPMQLPLCDTDAQQSQLEDQLIRAAIMPDADGSEKLIKETAIKLFALSCRSELEARAKELVELIACPELLQLAVKYATKLGRIHLADRLTELLPQLAEPDQSFQTAFVPFMPTPTHTVSSSPSTAKLAPKAMELSHAKRASFKRYSASASTSSHTPNSFKRSTTTETESNGKAPLDTQENIFESSESSTFESQNRKESQLSSTTGSIVKASNESTKETRSPLNAVNPFASKRKIGDVDFIMGGKTLSNCLKKPKK